MQITDPENYATLLEKKVASFTSQLAQATPHALPNLTVHESQRMHYRMRTEFRIWHEGDTAHYAMHDPISKKPYLLDSFPVASQAINQLMSPLINAINQQEILRRKLFQIEFLNTRLQILLN